MPCSQLQYKLNCGNVQNNIISSGLVVKDRLVCFLSLSRFKVFSSLATWGVCTNVGMQPHTHCVHVYMLNFHVFFFAIVFPNHK